MTDKSQLDQIKEAFFNNGYNIAQLYLEKGITKENLWQAIKHNYRQMDSFIDEFLKNSKSQGVPTACRKGCAHCCHQAVLILPHEALYLSEYINKNFQEIRNLQVMEKAVNKNKVTSSQGINKVLTYKERCPLLHPTLDFCRAYTARPMACRIYLSKDETSCKRDLDHPKDDSIFPDLYELPLIAGQMQNEGFHSYLRKFNLQADEITLEQGIVKGTKDQAFDKWANKTRIFSTIRK